MLSFFLQTFFDFLNLYKIYKICYNLSGDDMKKNKKQGNSIEIVVLIGIIFFLFVGLVLMYEEKIDNLEDRISILEEVCNEEKN